jgi:hypothetical protein
VPDATANAALDAGDAAASVDIEAGPPHPRLAGPGAVPEGVRAALPPPEGAAPEPSPLPPPGQPLPAWVPPLLGR